MSRDEDDHEDVSFPDAQCVSSTPMALLCRVIGDEHWIPRSVISDDSEVYERGHVGKLVVRKWFARKELGA
jgi:hypothetical protein